MKRTILLVCSLLLLVQITIAQKQKTVAVFDATKRPKQLSDSALLDLVQQQTFRYFWDFAHPISGLSRERSNVAYEYGAEVVTTGGTGFGIMSVLVAAERKWISRDTAAKFLLRMVKFLSKADAYHGVFPHWLNGATGKTIPFSRKDDGADLVETSYLMQGLLCALATRPSFPSWIILLINANCGLFTTAGAPHIRSFLLFARSSNAFPSA